MDHKSPPILFLVFNRPDLTERVLTRIRDVQPSRLYIAADGPRPSKPGESELCDRTRRAAEAIDWPCEIHKLYRESNLGCRIAVSEAIAWFFQQEPEGIILEDDVLPDLSFFPFAAEMLERYRDDPRIAVVNAASFARLSLNPSASYYFTRFPLIWGWASWRRTWDRYDIHLARWPESKDRINSHLPTRAAARCFTSAFEQTKAGKIDTWDYQLAHSVFERGSICISPRVNLVENIGFDDRATHTAAGTSPTADFPIQEITFPLSHPQVAFDSPADRQIAARFYTEPTAIHQRVIAKAKRILRRIGRGSKRH